jgi:hypothetical protein
MQLFVTAAGNLPVRRGWYSGYRYELWVRLTEYGTAEGKGGKKVADEI